MKNPIGIFDSGVGGLTVFREIARLLPNEDVIYLGDTARLPYGNKSPETILSYSKECAEFLLHSGIKLLVIACHTASSHALASLQEELPIPVLGMLRPGIELISESGLNHISLLGTEATLSSQAYQLILAKEHLQIKLYPVACPLFVPLAEEGMHLHPICRLVADYYLRPLKKKPVQAALLACTHYPLLADAIQEALGPSVQLLEPANRCAQNVKLALHEKSLLEISSKPGIYRFYTTDHPERFARLAERFLGFSIPAPIKKLELNKNLNYS